MMFKKKSPVIILDEGPLSSKMCIIGRMGPFGCLRISKYKGGKLKEYSDEINIEDAGETLCTILFGTKEGVLKMADGLRNLYNVMCAEETGDGTA